MLPIFYMPTILASQTMGIFNFETFKSLRLTNIVLRVRTSTSTLWKVRRTKGTSNQLQAPLDDQPWNEMKFNRLYESCVAFLKVPKGFPKFPIEFS